MAKEPQDILTDHEYDGIREYDNPTPGWWTWLFVVTIIFSVLYFPIVLAGRGELSPIGAYDRAVIENTLLQFAEIGELTPDGPTLVRFSQDEKWLGVGRTIYITHCISCHGSAGEGLVGSNLTDDYWKNVKVIEDIALIVQEGAAGGAMPAWQNRLNTNEIVLVSAYVASLRGSNPGSGRPAEGTVIPPWPIPAPEEAEAPATTTTTIETTETTE